MKPPWHRLLHALTHSGVPLRVGDNNQNLLHAPTLVFWKRFECTTVLAKSDSDCAVYGLPELDGVLPPKRAGL